MNKNQRNKNRETAQTLRRVVHYKEVDNHICENCGERGLHWVTTRGVSLEAIMTGIDDSQGFWICSKYYDADGKRIPV